MFKKVFLLALSLSFVFISGINLAIPQSAVQNAVSGFSLIYTSPSATSVNPALVSAGLETSVTYLFNLKEVPFYNFHSGIHLGNFGIHLGNAFLNHELYRENLLEMSIAYRWQSFKIGVSANHLFVAVANYETETAIKFDAGIIYENKNFSTGFSVLNVSQTKCQNKLLPVVINWESCLTISSKSKLAIGFEKENNFDFALKFAGRYDFFNSFSLLTSYQYNPDRIGIGTVFDIGNFHFIYSVRTHQYLNLTHYVTIKYYL